MTFTVTIPDEIAQLLGVDPSREALEGVLASLYREDKIGKPQIRAALGFTSWYEIEAFMQHHRLNEYTLEDLQHDLDFIKKKHAEEKAEAA